MNTKTQEIDIFYLQSYSNIYTDFIYLFLYLARLGMGWNSLMGKDYSICKLRPPFSFFQFYSLGGFFNGQSDQRWVGK